MFAGLAGPALDKIKAAKVEELRIGAVGRGGERVEIHESVNYLHGTALCGSVSFAQWVSPKPGWIYVLDVGGASGHIFVVDPSAGVKGVLQTDYQPTFGICSGGSRLYVLDGAQNAGTLSTFDTHLRALQQNQVIVMRGGGGVDKVDMLSLSLTPTIGDSWQYWQPPGGTAISNAGLVYHRLYSLCSK